MPSDNAPKFHVETLLQSDNAPKLRVDAILQSDNALKSHVDAFCTFDNATGLRVKSANAASDMAVSSLPYSSGKFGGVSNRKPYELLMNVPTAATSFL